MKVATFDKCAKSKEIEPTQGGVFLIKTSQLQNSKAMAT